LNLFKTKGSCKTPIDSESLSQWAFSGPSQTLPISLADACASEPLWIGFFISLLQWKSRNTLVKVARMIELEIRDSLVKCNSCDGTGVCPECLGTGDGPPDATNWLGNRTKPEHFCSCSEWTSEGFSTQWFVVEIPNRVSFGRCTRCNGTGSISREVFEKEQQENQDRLQRELKPRLDDLVLAVSIIESIDYSSSVYSIVPQIANRCFPKVKDSSPLTSSSNGEKLFSGVLSNGKWLRSNLKEIRVTVFSDGIQYKPSGFGGKLDWISSHQLRGLPTMEWSDPRETYGTYREIVIGDNRMRFFPGLCAFFVCLRHFFCLLDGAQRGEVPSTDVDNQLKQAVVELQNRPYQ